MQSIPSFLNVALDAPVHYRVMPAGAVSFGRGGARLPGHERLEDGQAQVLDRELECAPRLDLSDLVWVKELKEKLK